MSEIEEIENSWEFCWKCGKQLQPFKCPNGCPEEKEE
tara:strand:- start:341 stop:451 length:111 start_codon:yes stop_codon:yes gene_type:complete